MGCTGYVAATATGDTAVCELYTPPLTVSTHLTVTTHLIRGRGLEFRFQGTGFRVTGM
jgi:hypothetical protein